jgi:DNA end-binding protein Ku
VSSTVWNGQLTFGLVSFAVRLVRAARKDRIPLRYVRETEALQPADDMGVALVTETATSRLPDHSNGDARDMRDGVNIETVITPVHQAYVAPDQAHPMQPGELQHAYEVTPGRFAVVRAEELRRLRQPTSAEMQILRSVHMEEIDPVFLETSYYIHPGSGAEHSYGLFYRALRESGYAALAEVAMHGRQHVLVIRSGANGLIAHTMYYVNEVRAGEEHATAVANVPAKELDLAKRFVEAIAEPFRPDEFTDRYREELESLITSKEAVGSRSPEPATLQKKGKVIDIMDALRKSLEKVQAQKSIPRKPVAVADAPRKSRKRRA